MVGLLAFLGISGHQQASQILPLEDLKAVWSVGRAWGDGEKARPGSKDSWGSK